MSRWSASKVRVALPLALVLSGSALAMAWPRAATIPLDPMVAADVKQARALTRQGAWADAAALLADHAAGPNPQAKLEYALLLTRGWGVQRDLERARQLLLQAVVADFDGRGRAAFELGRLYKVASGKDCSRIAFEWFSKAANWRYERAHLEIAAAYRKGVGTAADPKRAMKHYRIAAEGGSAAAIWSMIEMAERGTAVSEPDPEQARQLAELYLPILEVEAQSGSAYAARTLARLFLRGSVIDKDVEAASRWFGEAATLGDPAAMHDLALLIVEAGEGGTDGETALDLLKESARRGYPGAMTALGRMHLEGRWGLKREAAIEWLEQGVAAGHAGAMAELAKLFLNGDLVQRDLARARGLAEKGASLRHRGSARLLEKINQEVGAKSGMTAIGEG